MVMSYHHLPAVKHYWSISNDLEVFPIKTRTRKTFKFILGNLHVNDNHKMDKTYPDRLYKIRPSLDYLNSKFVERFHAENLSLNKSMIKFKGYSLLKQYNPIEPIKRGYTTWCLYDNDGSIYKF